MLGSQAVCCIIASVLFATVVFVGIEKLDFGAQRQIAVSFDGDNAKQNFALDDVWFDQHQQDEAAAETHAIGVDLNHPNAHLYQANFFRTQGKQADSTAEYREAIRLDPQLAAAYYKLGLGLRDLAHSSLDARDRTRRLRDACRVFMLGANFAAANPDFAARMQDIDVLLSGDGRCPSE